METTEILSQCTVEGNVVTLPPTQLDRQDYLAVAKRLELIGGKWNRKSKGFVFPDDPTALLSEVVQGKERNVKKEFQFYATPEALADRLVDLASITNYRGEARPIKVLEPSAGQGAIVKAIARRCPGMVVDCFELMPVNQTFLRSIPTANLIGDDFLTAKPSPVYDRIIANPPFAKNQDIEHIRTMYDWLAPGGVLVSVASRHWITTKHKVCKDFKDRVGVWEDIEAGAFEESGAASRPCALPALAAVPTPVVV